IATQSQLQYSPRPRRCQPGLDLRSAQREGGPREDRPAAMWQGFTIALREGIESFLIAALPLSYLRRTGRPGLARAVYAGIAVSAVACVAAGLFFSQDEKKPLWEGLLARAAAALVGSLLVYMKRVSSRMKSDMEQKIETRARAFSARRAFWGVFAFHLLMIILER